MRSQALPILAIGSVLTLGVYAQNYQRQAAITGGGGPDRGKCTVEVVVDGVAQVEIRGASATLRNVSGQPPQWRRFECTGVMPNNPANFRFAGVDGRGRQQLVRNPANGGVAVVQIEDPEGGAEGYTFDLFWDSRGPGNGVGQYDPNQRPGGNPPGAPPDYRGNDQYRDRSDYRYRDYPDNQYRPNYRDSDYYRRYHHGFAVDEAIRVCKDAIFNQASRRFRSSDIHFLRTTIDDNPGREDWVIGSVDVHRGPREERYGFSCSVNFDTGQVRSAQLEFRSVPYDERR